VYLLSYGVASEAPQGFTLISRPIATLYRSYVAAGCIPGQPSVVNGHLFLPILSASSRVRGHAGVPPGSAGPAVDADQFR
jgi:hypothetical protein